MSNIVLIRNLLKENNNDDKRSFSSDFQKNKKYNAQ